ncbi:hypothetical protein AB0M12_41280 [Nocardia vinacea]
MSVSRWAAAAFTTISVTAWTGVVAGTAQASGDLYGAIAISFHPAAWSAK